MKSSYSKISLGLASCFAVLGLSQYSALGQSTNTVTPDTATVYAFGTVPDFCSFDASGATDSEGTLGFDVGSGQIGTTVAGGTSALLDVVCSGGTGILTINPPAVTQAPAGPVLSDLDVTVTGTTSAALGAGGTVDDGDTATDFVVDDGFGIAENLTIDFLATYDTLLAGDYEFEVTLIITP
jgi:hypothetical protein